MHPFEVFLQEHHIEPLALALHAQVRYVTMWNAMKGKSVSPEQAGRIRQAAQDMAGVAYTGPLVSSGDKPVEQQPTLRLRTSTRLLQVPNS